MMPQGAIRKIWRSLAMKLALLVVVFVAVPIIVYNELRTADERQQEFLLKSVSDRGRLVAESLRPLLQQYEASAAPRLGQALARLAAPDLKTKVLFRPEGANSPDNFYYVASQPSVPTEVLEIERADLLRTGVFERVRDSCETFVAPSVRYTNPQGQEELLAALIPVLTRSGCWVIITSSTAQDILGSSLGQPYWKTPQVRVAALIYVLMALFVIWLFGDVWRSLLRFARVARGMSSRGKAEGSFAEAGIVPELTPVARELDGLVAALDGSAKSIRYAAEENAHAFKTPLGVIAQSLESLKRSVSPDNARGMRSITLIEQALSRLDGLVSAARHMDEVSAELLDPPRLAVDLSKLVAQVGEDYADTMADTGRKLAIGPLARATVKGGEDLIETVLENLLDNAESFSPEGGEIKLALNVEDRAAVLTVEDEGPGVDPADVERIFDRYYSMRDPGNGALTNGNGEATHFGIGLWVVRRNVEALGGRVRAENCAPHGLRVKVTLPLA